MLFNSIPFLYFFLPITYFVFWRLRSRSSRYIWLALTGYVFYGFWDYRFCALMALSTVISYVAGLAMLRWPTGYGQKTVPLVADYAGLVIARIFQVRGLHLVVDARCRRVA